jgi:hypothetical protein
VSGWSYLSDSAEEQNKKHLKNGKRSLIVAWAACRFSSGPPLIGVGLLVDDRLGVIIPRSFCLTSFQVVSILKV